MTQPFNPVAKPTHRRRKNLTNINLKKLLLLVLTPWANGRDTYTASSKQCRVTPYGSQPGEVNCRRFVCLPKFNALIEPCIQDTTNCLLPPIEGLNVCLEPDGPAKPVLVDQFRLIDDIETVVETWCLTPQGMQEGIAIMHQLMCTQQSCLHSETALSLFDHLLRYGFIKCIVDNVDFFSHEEVVKLFMAISIRPSIPHVYEKAFHVLKSLSIPQEFLTEITIKQFDMLIRANKFLELTNSNMNGLQIATEIIAYMIDLAVNNSTQCSADLVLDIKRVKKHKLLTLLRDYSYLKEVIDAATRDIIQLSNENPMAKLDVSERPAFIFPRYIAKHLSNNGTLRDECHTPWMHPSSQDRCQILHELLLKIIHEIFLSESTIKKAAYKYQ